MVVQAKNLGAKTKVLSDQAGTSLRVWRDARRLGFETAAESRILDGHTPLTVRGAAILTPEGFQMSRPTTMQFVFGGEEAPDGATRDRVEWKILEMLGEAADAGLLRTLLPPVTASGTALQQYEHALAAMETARNAHRDAVVVVEDAQRALAEAAHQVRRCTEMAACCRELLGDPSDSFEAYWTGRGGSVAHFFVPGPGVGDTSLCGVALGSDGRTLQSENDPICSRCSAIAVAEALTDVDG